MSKVYFYLSIIIAGSVQFSFQFYDIIFRALFVVQSKNHTGRNAVHKDHANRIKKTSRHQTKGLNGVRLGFAATHLLPG